MDCYSERIREEMSDDDIRKQAQEMLSHFMIKHDIGSLPAELAEKIAGFAADEAAVARAENAALQSILQPLQEIARLTNLYLGGSCCEEHYTATEREIIRLLRLFEDDSFEKLEQPK